jgi:hypothetical protein
MDIILDPVIAANASIGLISLVGGTLGIVLVSSVVAIVVRIDSRHQRDK